MKLRNLMLAASLIGVGVLAWYYPGRARPESSSRNLTAPSDAAEPAKDTGTTNLAILPSLRPELAIYSLDVSTEVDFDRQDGESQNTELVISGELGVSLPVAQGETKVWRAQLDIRTISGTPIPATLNKQMSAPFAVRVANDGQVAEIGVPKGMQEMALKLSRIVAATMQFSPSTRSDPSSMGWTRKERDVVGQHLAKYQRISPTKFKKQKVNYQSFSGVLAPNHSVARGKDVAGEVEYEFAESGQLIRASGRDTLAMQLGNRTVSTEVGTGLKYQRNTPGSIELEEEQLTWFRLGDLVPRFGVAHQPPDEPVTSNMADLVAQIRSISTVSSEARRQALALLGHKLRQEPGATTYLIDELRHLQPGEVADSLLSALTDANTDEGRRAIMSVAQDSTMPLAIRDSAVVQIGLDERATEETVRGLTDLTRESVGSELHTTAALALGASIYHANHDPNAMNTTTVAGETLTKLLETAKTPGEREAYLQAIGNSGSAAAYGELSPYLSSTDTSTRVTAYSALRRMPGEQVDVTLANAITNELNSEVRDSALAAAMERNLSSTTVAALSNALRTDSSTGAHELIIKELGHKNELPAELIAALQWVQDHGVTPEVREQAATLVKRLATTATIVD